MLLLRVVEVVTFLYCTHCPRYVTQQGETSIFNRPLIKFISQPEVSNSFLLDAVAPVASRLFGVC